MNIKADTHAMQKVKEGEKEDIAGKKTKSMYWHPPRLLNPIIDKTHNTLPNLSHKSDDEKPTPINLTPSALFFFFANRAKPGSSQADANKRKTETRDPRKKGKENPRDSFANLNLPNPAYRNNPRHHTSPHRIRYQTYPPSKTKRRKETRRKLY